MDYIYRRLLQNILVSKVIGKQVPKKDILAASSYKI